MVLRLDGASSSSLHRNRLTGDSGAFSHRKLGLGSVKFFQEIKQV
jgi:hypothetical protein